jgi:hypothetical protein
MSHWNHIKQIGYSNGDLRCGRCGKIAEIKYYMVVGDEEDIYSFLGSACHEHEQQTEQDIEEDLFQKIKWEIRSK